MGGLIGVDDGYRRGIW